MRVSIQTMRVMLVMISIGLICPSVQGQTDWKAFGGDPGGQRYSSLTQINTGNVTKLVPAWTYHMKPASVAAKPAETTPPPRGRRRGGAESEATPLVVGGVMYLTTAYNRVVALEPETGNAVWQYEVKGGSPASRGLEYWPGDRQTPPRLFFGTSDGRLIAIDARTGQPVQHFGKSGEVDMKAGVMNGYDDTFYGLSSPPNVYKNLVITGAHTQESPSLGASGDVRAWDARTGKIVWEFHTVPRPGEVGHETWEGDSWKARSGANVWGMMTVDTERGLVFLPLGSPTYDYYGGDRKGANLFGDTLVALDAGTGKLKWYLQHPRPLMTCQRHHAAGCRAQGGRSRHRPDGEDGLFIRIVTASRYGVESSAENDARLAGRRSHSRSNHCRWRATVSDAKSLPR